MRKSASVILAVALFVTAAHAQSQVVRVTVPKANVRSEPNDKAPILQQATPKDQIEWRATEGDWFKVLLPPNSALGGARVEAYISKKVSKLEAVKALAASAEAPVARPVEPAVPAIDTHAANVFLGTIVDGMLLNPEAVAIVTNGNRQAFTIQKSATWNTAAERRPAFVVSIGDRAGFSTEGLAPAIVKLSQTLAIGSTKPDGKDWKSEDVSLEMTQGTVGVWNLKPAKDLKPGDYAIIMRSPTSKSAAPQIAWPFTVK